MNFKEYIETVNNKPLPNALMDKDLHESGLLKIWDNLNEYSTGFITAFRAKYTKKENMQRNAQLKAKLFKMGYQVTPVRGNYIEEFGTPNAKEVGENSFFVVNPNKSDNKKLENDLMKLGELYDQDSVLSIPHGKDAVLIGTNKTGYPGYHKRLKQGNAKFGSVGEFLTRVNGRPIVFNESMLGAQGYLGKQAQSKIAEMDWKDIDV